MGAIGGLLGLNGGANGTGYAAPATTAINAGTNANQLGGALGTAQQGLGAQAGALTGQQQLLQALQAQNGIGNQSQVYNQLQGIANGTGPNPAQAALAQATGQNIAAQQAAQAGQRGAGANVGLMARNAGMIGANAQQQAAGQAATLQAQQSLNALNQAGGIAGNQVANQIGAQSGITGAAQGLSSGAQGEQNILQGANTAANNANVTMQGNVNTANASLADQQMQGQQGLLGGILGGVGGALGIKGLGGGLAEGGEVPTQFGLSTPGDFLARQQSGAMPLAKGGAVQNLGDRLKAGGKVPGTPKVKGDSYKNDTTKALLSPGEVVIPNSVMQSKDPVRGAGEFVRAVLAKKRGVA